MFWSLINSLSPEMKIAEFANRVDLDEVAHNEPPHPDLHCLLSSLRILNIILLGLTIFLKILQMKIMPSAFW